MKYGLAGVTDPRSLSFDKSIMQTKTVGNICRLLTEIQGKHRHTRSIIITHILTEYAKALKSRKNRIHPKKAKTKKTTVDAKVKQLKKGG